MSDEHTTTSPSRGWWDGHRAGFAKGLYTARLQTLEMAKDPEYSETSVWVLRLLAAILHRLQEDV